ncbi:Golgi-associated RAB2 interactor protein 1A-like [Rhineura floridana]|uniref:Golgi-associated RAB2 interactor protein 1A-like n=1 Tax=Rhineura floridana TaxID=261503 RepID=UPI002AC80561|nr:Golgi-associated RAB2 interactor protein 1A-like [Rhineura floridana]
MARGALARIPDAGKALGLEGGLLCQLVRSPDYNLFPNSAVFESNFIQVTKKGEWVDITNMPTIVTMGVTSSDPCLPLPNVLLMARYRMPPRRGNSEALKHPAIDLTRLLPLRYVRLSVHDDAQRILRIQTVTRKVYYLQLHQEHPRAVFALWSRLADILQKGLSITTKDPAIRIRHSLVPSGSSSSSSSSSTEVTGYVCPPSQEKEERKGGRRRVSFQAEVQEEGSSLSNDIKVLFYDMPPPLVCARCKGHLPKTSCRGSSKPGSQESDLDLLPWIEGRSHGLWQQETPSWLQPLCRLSSLAAAGWK